MADEHSTDETWRIAMSQSDIENEILAETTRLDNLHRAFVQMGQAVKPRTFLKPATFFQPKPLLNLKSLFAYDDAEFVRLAYGVVFGRPATLPEFNKDLALLREALSRRDLLSQLRLARDGARSPESAVGSKRDSRLALWTATWFGVGFTPLAPGTAGTLAALPLHWLLMRSGIAVELICIVVISCLGIWSAKRVELDRGEEDPQIVVIDEVTGVLIALLVAGSSISAQVVAFVAFRAFDIWKPWPINRLEDLSHKGLAIMADDILAGVLAAFCTGLWLWMLR